MLYELIGIVSLPLSPLVLFIPLSSLSYILEYRSRQSGLVWHGWGDRYVGMLETPFADGQTSAGGGEEEPK